MELSSILSIAITSLIMIVLSHVAVFWVVRTLYPPAPTSVPVYVPTLAQVTPQVFTEAPRETQQAVNVPTYETPLQLEASNQEGSTDLSLLSGPSTNGNSGLVAANA